MASSDASPLKKEEEEEEEAKEEEEEGKEEQVEKRVTAWQNRNFLGKVFLSVFIEH